MNESCFINGYLASIIEVNYKDMTT